MSETAAILADALRVIRLRTIEECARIAEQAYIGLPHGMARGLAKRRTAQEAARRIRALLADDAECHANHNNEFSDGEAPCQAL